MQDVQISEVQLTSADDMQDDWKRKTASKGKEMITAGSKSCQQRAYPDEWLPDMARTC